MHLSHCRSVCIPHSLPFKTHFILGFLAAVASRYISDQCMWTYSMFFPGTHTCKALSVGTYGWLWGMRLARWNGRCMIWFGWITDWFFVVRGTGPHVNVPFSGYTSSLWVNLTPFPPWTGEREGEDAEKYREKLRAHSEGIWEMERKKDRQKRKKDRQTKKKERKKETVQQAHQILTVLQN